MSNQKKHDSGAAEGARRATEQSPDRRPAFRVAAGGHRSER